MSLRSLEYLTANTHIAYPFKEDAGGLSYNEAYTHSDIHANIPLDLIFDAAITLPDTTTELYLYSITKLVDGSSRLSFSDEDNVVICTHDLAPVVLTGTYQIVDILNTVSNVYIRLLVGSAFVTYLAEILVGSTDLFNATLPFDPYVIKYSAQYVRQFAFVDSDTGVACTVSGDVTFNSGYNTVITAEDTDVPDSTLIRVEADQGLGLGLYPCIDENKPKIPLVIADANGNINITGDSCVNVVMHNSAGIIELQNDCEACCTCQDYVRAGEAIRATITRIDQLRQNFLTFHELLTTNIEAFNANVALEPDISLKLIGSLGATGASRTANILVVVGNRMYSETMTITSITLTADTAASVTYTNFNPTTAILVPRSGKSFWYIMRSATAFATWGLTAVVNYTNGSQSKSITTTATIT